ncbi:MAG TPA: hypothetical protein PK154_09730, partial [Methanoregulaceae archaeon]|nr:hypothetical protein [Methanoregulaceae archaeon]
MERIARHCSRNGTIPYSFSLFCALKAEAGLFPGTNSVIVTVVGASFSGRRLDLAGGGVRWGSLTIGIRFVILSSHRRAKSQKTRAISSTLIGLTRDSIF